MAKKTFEIIIDDQWAEVLNADRVRIALNPCFVWIDEVIGGEHAIIEIREIENVEHANRISVSRNADR